MHKLKFIILGPKTENTKDLAHAIKTKGHLPFIVNIKDICLQFENGIFKALWNNKNILTFDIFLLRGYNKNIPFVQIIAQELIRLNKTVIDETIGKKFIPSKTYEASAIIQEKLNHPRTFQSVNFHTWKKILPKTSFPAIVKPIYSQKGQNIKKIINKEAYLEFFSENPQGYLLQEFIKIDSDIRIFVVDNKVLGAIKRFILPGDFRSNASLGSRAEKIIPTKKMKDIALKITKKMGYEISGVDLIEHKRKLYILEVNSTPQWQKFKETTGINPAKAIVDYAIKKYSTTFN